MVGDYLGGYFQCRLFYGLQKLSKEQEWKGTKIEAAGSSEGSNGGSTIVLC